MSNKIGKAGTTAEMKIRRIRLQIQRLQETKDMYESKDRWKNSIEKRKKAIKFLKLKNIPWDEVEDKFKIKHY